MTIVERIQKQLDAGNFTAGVFINLNKVFNTADQLEKLDYYGIRGVAKNWLSSYLKIQKQWVMFNGSTSSIKPVICTQLSWHTTWICFKATSFPDLNK